MDASSYLPSRAYTCASTCIAGTCCSLAWSARRASVTAGACFFCRRSASASAVRRATESSLASDSRSSASSEATRPVRADSRTRQSQALSREESSASACR
ncbi:hypothetical protein COSO111634_36450 [Corallococcus soli]